MSSAHRSRLIFVYLGLIVAMLMATMGSFASSPAMASNTSLTTVGSQEIHAQAAELPNWKIETIEVNPEDPNGKLYANETNVYIWVSFTNTVAGTGGTQENSDLIYLN